MKQIQPAKKPIFFGWDRVAVSIAPALGGLIMEFTIREHKYPARYQAVAASAGD